MPRYFENGLLDAISEGGKSAFWGVFAIWAGFAWGGVIFAHNVNAMHWTGLWAMIVMLGVVGGTSWGWILLPVLSVFFYGAIWREWNRLVVASALATFVGAIGFRYYWDWGDNFPWHRLACPIALLFFAILLPPLLRLLRPRLAPPASHPENSGTSSQSSPSSHSRLPSSSPANVPQPMKGPRHL